MPLRILAVEHVHAERGLPPGAAESPDPDEIELDEDILQSAVAERYGEIVVGDPGWVAVERERREHAAAHHRLAGACPREPVRLGGTATCYAEADVRRCSARRLCDLVNDPILRDVRGARAEGALMVRTLYPVTED